MTCRIFPGRWRNVDQFAIRTHQLLLHESENACLNHNDAGASPAAPTIVWNACLSRNEVILTRVSGAHWSERIRRAGGSTR